MSLRRPTGLHALLLLPLLAIVAWIVVRGRSVREDPAAVLEALRASHGPAVPSAAAIGASSRLEVGTFDRETLYEYIDGAADGYLENGFQRCAAADYTIEVEGGAAVELTIEVYRFADHGGARQQLAAERPAVAGEVPGVPGAVSDGTVLLATVGRDYVKAVTLTPGPAAAAALVRVAKTIGGNGDGSV